MHFKCSCRQISWFVGLQLQPTCCSIPWDVPDWPGIYRGRNTQLHWGRPCQFFQNENGNFHFLTCFSNRCLIVCVNYWCHCNSSEFTFGEGALGAVQERQQLERITWPGLLSPPSGGLGIFTGWICTQFTFSGRRPEAAAWSSWRSKKKLFFFFK